LDDFIYNSPPWLSSSIFVLVGIVAGLRSPSRACGTEAVTGSTAMCRTHRGRGLDSNYRCPVAKEMIPFGNRNRRGGDQVRLGSLSSGYRWFESVANSTFGARLIDAISSAGYKFGRWADIVGACGRVHQRRRAPWTRMGGLPRAASLRSRRPACCESGPVLELGWKA
jgi:hypothetical protein